MTINNAAIENSIPFVERRIASGSTAIPRRQTTSAPTVTPTIHYEWLRTERNVQYLRLRFESQMTQDDSSA